MLQKIQNSQKCFSLMELMIVVAIVGILAAIAIPSYQDYTRRARFTEVVDATSPAKLGVNDCFQTTGALTNCNGGAHGVPVDMTGGTGQTKSITTSAGVITAIPNTTNGFLETDTYMLTPTITTPTTGAAYLTWAVSGGAVTKGYAR